MGANDWPLSVNHRIVPCRFSYFANGDFYASILVLMSYGTTYDECAECMRLLAKYEAATFEDARIHNAFDLANRLGDYTSSRHIKLEVDAVTARRYGARAAFLQHQGGAHLAAFTSLSASQRSH
jgi:hypothetical protein